MSTAGPLLGADVWRQVVTQAGGRCSCTGECGSRHRSGNGRCLQEDSPFSPLHAVPRSPAANPTAEMSLSAQDLMALCDGCHDRLLTRRRKAARHAHAEAIQGLEGLW